MSAADFWRLDVDSVWWFIEAKMGVKLYGSLTEDDAEELYDMMKERGI
jgi:hypothetical protein